MSPCRELRLHGLVADWCPLDRVDAMLPRLASGFYNVLILPRLGFSEPEARERFFASFRRAELAIVYDCDDDVFSPPIVARQRGTVERERSAEDLERQRLATIAMVREVDGVTVSSPDLAHVVADHTDRPVEVVPNAIDTRFWSVEVRRAVRKWRETTIGWVGGIRPGDDLRPMAEAWGRIAKRHPRVGFVCSATAADLFSRHVPKQRLHVLPWMPIDWATKPDGAIVPPYPHGLVNIDVGCAAVSPRLFNLRKTVIKVWEYALAGAACVATPTLYGRTITDGEDGLLAETVDEWEDALDWMVIHPRLRRRLADAQRGRVYREHALTSNWPAWPRAWAGILAARDARLARALATA